ncbi:hypothetical protein KTAU_20480 [Thermogemmatispora aurantia]|uniref:Uncharacterized protein n=1 Tax=Thermogemmatispora aurantia TaxID=2045279 RepID=A0A5J4K9P7_9CHLR|nr:hypothetical protein KTAU_20480 [Thermogemmatispora aurantia]
MHLAERESEAVLPPEKGILALFSAPSFFLAATASSTARVRVAFSEQTNWINSSVAWVV